MFQKGFSEFSKYHGYYGTKNTRVLWYWERKATDGSVGRHIKDSVVARVCPSRKVLASIHNVLGPNL